MYHMTVHTIPDGWLDRQFPIPGPPGCHLHSFSYAPPERIVCVWEQVGAIPNDEWGDTTWAMREINDPVAIEG